MMNDGNATELIVRLFVDANDKNPIVYRAEAQDRADVEFHIDSYKEEFDRRLAYGRLKVGSWAGFSWVQDEKNFIMDSWDSQMQ
jgi:hypothetical protein